MLVFRQPGRLKSLGQITIAPGVESLGRAEPSHLKRHRFETREDVGVAESASICAACHRTSIRGDRNHGGDVFICAQCQADAAQLIAIQDSIWGEADQAAGRTRTNAQ